MADRFRHPHEDDDAAASADRFGDALALCHLAWNSQKTAASLRKLRKLKSDIAAAEAKLASVTAQAASLIEAAKAEAERIIKDAEDQTRERRNDLEHREAQLAYGERYARLFAAAKARSPNGVVSAFDAHQIRAQLAEEDDRSGNRVSFATFEQLDPDYRRADASGTVAVEMVKGSTLTKTFPNKPRREATQ